MNSKLDNKFIQYIFNQNASSYPLGNRLQSDFGIPYCDNTITSNDLIVSGSVGPLFEKDEIIITTSRKKRKKSKKKRRATLKK